MSTPDGSEKPFDRIRAAIDEWLDAFDAESAELVRAELAQIPAGENAEEILARIEKALRHLDHDADRLHARGEDEHRQAVASEQEAFAAVKAGDDFAAKAALARQNEHMERATKHFDDALQLKWLLNQYRSAAAAMGKGQVAHGEPGADDAENSNSP